MDFKNKYMKYKLKYLELKKQIGGIPLALADEPANIKTYSCKKGLPNKKECPNEEYRCLHEGKCLNNFGFEYKNIETLFHTPIIQYVKDDIVINGPESYTYLTWRNKNFLLLGDTHTDLRESETCSNSIDIVNYIDNIINLNKGIKCIDFFLETSNIGRLLENPSLRSDLIKSVKNSNQNMAMGKLRNYFLTKNKLMDDTEENEYFRFHDIDIRYYFPYNGILHSENNSLLQIIKFFNILKKDKNTGLSVLITYINKIFDYFIENDQHTINPDKSLIKDEDEKYIIDLINKQKNKCDLNIKSKIIEYTKLYLSDKIYNRLKNINENTLKIIVSDLKARIMDVYSLFRMFRKSDLDRDLKRVIKGCLIDKYNNIICYSGEDHNKFYINFLLSINAELIIQKNISNRSDPTKRCINIGKFIPFNN